MPATPDLHPVPPGVRIHGLPTTPASPRGRSLHATRTFPPGSPIATFTDPLVAVPSGLHALAVCDWCLKVDPAKFRPASTPAPASAPPVSVSACTACSAVAYCSKACQSRAWKTAHKLECAALGRLCARQRSGDPAPPGGSDQSVYVPTPIRVVMRLLLRLKAGDRAVRAAVGDLFADGGGGGDGEGLLEGNVEGFRRDEKVWRDLATQALTAATYAGCKELVGRRLDAVAELFCKIQTNAFDRSDPDTGQAGIFLHPVLAMANHSCVPNAFVCFSGRNAILRAEREIKEGEEIEISYVDFTLSKAERQNSLRLYHFQCQCPRCIDDLNVYQVCQTSPLIPLNTFSLQPNLQRFRQPSANRSLPHPIATGSAATQSLRSAAPHMQSFTEPLENARRQWDACKPLIEAKMFAIEPVPSTLHDLINFYQEDCRNLAAALSLACFLVTECHPFAHVAPFKPWRVKGVMLTATLLSHTAPLTMMGELPKTCSHAGLVAALCRCDQTSMCEALLRLVIRYGPMAHSDDWDVLKDAKELLEDIESLEGRELNATLLSAWSTNPQRSDCKAFFDEAVLKPINELAGFAIEIASAEMEGDSKAVTSRS